MVVLIMVQGRGFGRSFGGYGGRGFSHGGRMPEGGGHGRGHGSRLCTTSLWFSLGSSSYYF